MEKNRRLALLIDGDNAQASLLPQMLSAVSKHGTITIERVYGDWSEESMKSWKEVASNYKLDAEQKFRTSHDKNATDIALIMDAMDLLYNAKIDGFVIASSDSDYIPLVRYIREKGLYVLGIGKRLSSPSYVRVCDDFIYTEDLVPVVKVVRKPAPPAPTTPKTKVVKPVSPATSPKVKAVKPASPALIIPKAKAVQPIVSANPPRLKPMFQKAFASAVQEDGWGQMGTVGNYLRQLYPEFEPKTYGHKQLSQLVEAHPEFIETQKRAGKAGGEIIYIRVKANLNPAK